MCGGVAGLMHVEQERVWEKEPESQKQVPV